ncbi:MAG: hypothetical protein RL173_3686 [Fibrobacterota bacterium]|jgi:hypothetical protein
MSILLALGPVLAAPPEGTLVPPVQGAYLGFRSQVTANPWDANFSWNFGWREVVYSSEAPALAYNFIGMEFMSQSATHEASLGARMFVQPTSFFQTSLGYERVGFPFGIISFQDRTSQTDDALWTSSHEIDPSWADMFSWKWSFHREVGTVQWRIQGNWSRIDIDNTLDYLYIPNYDLISRSRDDLLLLDATVGFVTEAPFLAAVGPSYNYAMSVDHGIEQSRAGVWMQAWPFSSRTGEIIPYWTLKSRLDIWLDHSSRQWQPRLELTLGWERNIFQPAP